MSYELLELILAEADERMQRAVAHSRTEFSSVRTGRASSALVERLTVEAYGVDTPLVGLASFSVPEARMLVVTPFDKNLMGAIEKAIRNSDLGLNPSNDGQVIRLIFPALTEDRRKDLVKRVRGFGEDGKIAIRNIRRSARQEFDVLQKAGDVSEDDVARAEKELDKQTHAQEAAIDAALEQKEHELLEV